MRLKSIRQSFTKHISRYECLSRSIRIATDRYQPIMITNNRILIFQALNAKKSLPMERLPTILYNIACYLDCLPLEAGLGPGAATWSGLLTQFDGLFRRLVLMLSSIEDTTSLLRIMISLLKVPSIQQSKVSCSPLVNNLSVDVRDYYRCGAIVVAIGKT